MLTLAACSKDEVVQQNPNDAISFSIVTNKAVSRAIDGYCNNKLPDDFQVWAAAQGKKYFENETYEKYNDAKPGVSEVYKYKPSDGVMRYWPESGTVDFFATKNANGTVNFTASGTTSIAFTGFTVNGTVSAQTDFIYAFNKVAKTNYSNSST